VKTIIAALVVPLAALIGLLLMQRLEATLLPPATASEDRTAPPEPAPSTVPSRHPARRRRRNVPCVCAGCAHHRPRTHVRTRHHRRHPPTDGPLGPHDPATRR